MPYYDHAVLMALKLGPWAETPSYGRKRGLWRCLTARGFF